MELKKFITNLEDVFEDADPITIKPESSFRDLEGYSSLVALSIIAMADEMYNVKLKGDDIRKANTIEDLFNIINSK
ncbi:MAG: acyl carrier protein [Bacteroidales bacterium]|nr:acyl carrier protein [Bacteroidales bacterium]